jgi:molybdopterin synthase sulfur carrier subunit
MIRMVLPAHLRTLAGVSGEVRLELAAAPTWAAALDALEAAYPMLRGTIRDQATGTRRALVRYFADGQDFSHAAPQSPLPLTVAAGREPILIVGAIAGG